MRGTGKLSSTSKSMCTGLQYTLHALILHYVVHIAAVFSTLRECRVTVVNFVRVSHSVTEG